MIPANLCQYRAKGQWAPSSVKISTKSNKLKLENLLLYLPVFYILIDFEQFALSNLFQTDFISFPVIIFFGICVLLTFIFRCFSSYLSEVNYLKSVRIRIYSSPHFPVLGLNTEKYGVSLPMRKNADHKTPNMDTFYGK